MSEAEALASLDDVLSDNEPAAVEQEVITGEPEAQAEVEQEAAENLEQEVEAKAEEPKQDSPPESEVEQEWTKTMALDERRKRQEIERELEALRNQRAEAEKVETPDVFENQEAFVEHMRGEMQAELAKSRIETSQEIMRSIHQDYDAKEAAFIEMARENPLLIQEMNQSRNPAKFAYDTAVKAEKLAMLDNVDELEARIRAEVEAKVRAEIEGESKQQAESLEQKRKSVPPSLTNASGKSGFDSDTEETLEDILG